MLDENKENEKEKEEEKKLQKEKKNFSLGDPRPCAQRGAAKKVFQLFSFFLQPKNSQGS